MSAAPAGPRTAGPGLGAGPVDAGAHTRWWLFSALTIGFGIGCALFFRASYRDAKEVALSMLRDEQRIHARQAALGIEDFFANWTSSLSALSRIEGIVRNDASGRHDMRLFFEAHQEVIRSIIRVDERGVILVSHPTARSEGSDISGQRHVGEILRDHRPVVSDVFRAVQGFDAIALHVPVFDGEAFRGTIGVTFNFESLAHRYFDVIRIGRTGFAWVLSRDGTFLYSPVPGLTGKSASRSFEGSPSITAMFSSMVEGGAGATTYTSSQTGDPAASQATMFAVYAPIIVGSTFWSVAVTSSEEELLASLNSLRNRLALMVGIVFVAGMLLSSLVVRAWLMVRASEERRRAEEALRESESRHRTVLHTAMDGFLMVDVDGRLQEVNASYCRMSGYAGPELLGMRIQDIEAAGPAGAKLGRLQEIVAQGEIRFETRHRRSDGSLFDVEVSTQYQPHDGGRIVVFVRDITARKRADGIREAAYRISAAAESAGSLAELFALAHEIVRTLIPAKNFYLALVDRKAGTLGFPYFVDEVDSPPAPRPLGRGLTEHVIRTGEPLLATPEVFAGLAARGEVESLGAPSVDWLGAPLNVSGSTIGAVVVQSYTSGVRFGAPDLEFLSFISSQLAMVIERKRAEAEVRHAMAYNRSLIEASMDPLVTIGQDGRILDVNEATVRATGASREELVGTDFAERFTEPEKVRSSCLQAFRERNARGYEARLRHRDGSSIPVEYNLTVYRDAGGTVQGVLAAARDITERKEIEEALRESEAGLRALSEEQERRVSERTAELTEANRELEAYSYSVSHELRSPLRAIDGFTARIARTYEGLLDEEGRRLFGLLRWNAQRMGQLIDDLLSFSKAGRTGLTFGTVEMTRAAREAFTHVLADPAAASRISLSMGELPEARGDASLLRRVWENLLSNAVKFSAGRERPEIRVEGAVVGGEAVYSVSDNGVGFDRKYVEKLFGVFLRLHGVTEFEGTGVGLALVKRIVGRHGGRVWAEGEIGKGATFSFSLPVNGPSGSSSSPSSSWRRPERSPDPS